MDNGRKNFVIFCTCSNLILIDMFGTNIVSCSLPHRRSIILSLQIKPFKVKRSSKRAHLFTHNMHVAHTLTRSSFHHVMIIKHQALDQWKPFLLHNMTPTREKITNKRHLQSVTISTLTLVLNLQSKTTVM